MSPLTVKLLSRAALAASLLLAIGARPSRTFISVTSSVVAAYAARALVPVASAVAQTATMSCFKLSTSLWAHIRVFAGHVCLQFVIANKRLEKIESAIQGIA